MKWWITYTDGTKKYFTAKNYEEALRYAMLEGDHVLDFGRVK